jgi:hypothetical protein
MRGRYEKAPTELFSGKVMGEDALRILNDYRQQYAAIRTQVKRDLSLARETIAWAKSRMI